MKMGMEIFGHAPTAPEGEYFRRNIWGWHPLASLVTALCPDEAAPCKDWHCNGGHGLDAAEAATLSAKLETLRASGEVAAYCARHTPFWPRSRPCRAGFAAGQGATATRQ
jgi:hypothetical protein